MKMCTRANFAGWCLSWNADLTREQRKYLLKRYGTFQKALAVYSKAKDSGMVNFELLKN